MLGCIFHFYSIFNILQANSGEPGQTPISVASGLGLHYLPTSHKKDARLIWVKHDLETPKTDFLMKRPILASTDLYHIYISVILLSDRGCTANACG